MDDVIEFIYFFLLFQILFILYSKHSFPSLLFHFHSHLPSVQPSNLLLSLFSEKGSLPFNSILSCSRLSTVLGKETQYEEWSLTGKQRS